MLSNMFLCFWQVVMGFYGIVSPLEFSFKSLWLKDFTQLYSHLSLFFVSNLRSSPFFPWASASLLLTFVRFAGLCVYVFVCLNVCLCELLLCVACLIFIVRNFFQKFMLCMHVSILAPKEYYEIFNLCNISTFEHISWIFCLKCAFYTWFKVLFWLCA